MTNDVHRTYEYTSQILDTAAYDTLVTVDAPVGAAPLAAALGASLILTEHAYRYVARHRDRWARLLGIDATCQLRRR